MVVDVGAESRTEVLKALAEPARRRILDRLADEELCVCHLVDDLGIAQPLVSHHLKVLRRAGLVEAERFRQWTYYRLVVDELSSLVADLASLSERARTASRNRRPCC